MQPRWREQRKGPDRARWLSQCGSRCVQATMASLEGLPAARRRA